MLDRYTLSGWLHKLFTGKYEKDTEEILAQTDLDIYTTAAADAYALPITFPVTVIKDTVIHVFTLPDEYIPESELQKQKEEKYRQNNFGNKK